MGTEEGKKKLRDTSVQELAAHYSSYTTHWRSASYRRPNRDTHSLSKPLGIWLSGRSTSQKCGCSSSGQADGEGP